MPKLDQIVTTLNDRLKSGNLKGHIFQAGAFYGLTRSVVKGDNILPCSIDGGNEIDCTVNSKFPFQIYHKSETGSYPAVNDVRYGMTATYPMTAIVYYDIDKLNILAQDLAFLISSDLNKDFSKPELGTSGVQKVSINLQSARFDTNTIFNTEYPKYDSQKLGNKTRLISISYTVSVTANSSCITCDSCN